MKFWRKILSFLGLTSTTINDVPSDFKDIIFKHVAYYHTLPEKEREEFITTVFQFSTDIPISGLKIEINLKDVVLVSCSAIIPIFHLIDWHYQYLLRVFVTESYIPDEISGVRFGKATGLVRHSNHGFEVFLSRKSLYLGFSNYQDKSNVGLHEFAHVIDGMDGEVDGLPKFLMSEVQIKEWKKLKLKYIERIKSGETKINSYGATNSSEFFAVVTEFFYENPFMIKKRYPDLYEFLVIMYKTDLVDVYKRDMLLLLKEKNIDEQSNCPCKSGKKFKDCCLN